MLFGVPIRPYQSTMNFSVGCCYHRPNAKIVKVFVKVVLTAFGARIKPSNMMI